MMTQKLNPAMLTTSEIEAKMKNLKNYEDVRGFFKELVAPTLQGLLEAELENHLGYPKHQPVFPSNGNSRNGHRKKTLKTTDGALEIKIPRDRNGSFEPEATKRYETRSKALDEQVVALYAKGNSTSQIADFTREMYGVEITGDMVSSITDKLHPLIEEWQNRPLEACYPILYLDGIHFKVRDNGKIVSKCAYIAKGIGPLGLKEILGIWVGEAESSKFWLGVLNEIKNRGVQDILIVCVDGLTGFKEAIGAAFPKTEIQRCVVHQIRNTTKFIPHKHMKLFCNDLKTVYTAPTEEAGLSALAEVEKSWAQYKPYLKSWRDNWSELSTFFIYPEQIRKIIYTTNSIENLNRQLRSVTKTTVIFPHDAALKKLLWLAQRDISKKWTKPIRGWAEIAAQFSILFEDRFKL